MMLFVGQPQLHRVCQYYEQTVQYGIKPYGTVRLYRGQNPFSVLPRRKILILSPPKQSSVKSVLLSKVKYKLNSTKSLGQVTVQGAYNEPLWGELYVTWILSPVQSQLSHTELG